MKGAGGENGRNPLEVPVLGIHQELVSCFESLLWLFLSATIDACS